MKTRISLIAAFLLSESSASAQPRSPSPAPPTTGPARCAPRWPARETATRLTRPRSGTILLTSGELLVSNSITILGPGPANLAVDGNFPNTTNRVFHITPAVTVSISS